MSPLRTSLYYALAGRALRALGRALNGRWFSFPAAIEAAAKGPDGPARRGTTDDSTALTQTESSVCVSAVVRTLGMSFAAAAMVSLFVNLGTMVVPLYDMILYDRVLLSRNMDTLTALSVGCALGLVVFGALEWARHCIFLVMGDRLARRLNIPTLQAAVAKTLDGKGNAAAQALRDLIDLRGFVTGNAAAIPLDLLWSPGLAAVLFMLHPLYGAFGVGCAIVLFGLSLATDLATRKPLNDANNAQAVAINELASVLRNTDLLDGMGMLPAVARRWHRRAQHIGGELDRASRHAKAFAAAARSCRLLMQGGIIALGVILVIRHQASPGSMMGANLLVAKLLLPFEQLVGGWRQWVFALAAWNRIRAVLDQQPVRIEAVTTEATCELTVENLCFMPPNTNRAVLDQVSLRVQPGEVLAVIGPSAAGKSTLARLIVGLFAPSSGSVRVAGVEAASWDRAAFGRMVGYVPQSVALLDGTVFDNIARMEDADPAQVVDAAMLAGVHETIGRLPQGYDTWIGGQGRMLSGGQRQRIALARALFAGPKLVVLDEPNASLDHAGEQSLAETIRQLKQQGTAVVVVTHRPALLEIADTLLILKNGRVQHYGPPERVAASLTVDWPGMAALTRSAAH